MRLAVACAVLIGALPFVPALAENGTCYTDPDRAICVYNTEYEGMVASTSDQVFGSRSASVSAEQVAGLCSYTGQPTVSGGVQYQLSGSAAASSTSQAQPEFTDVKCTLTSPAQGLPGEMPTQTTSFETACPLSACASATTVSGWPPRPVVVCVDGYAIFGPTPVIGRDIRHACVTSATV
jgi:hypothetical protein